MGNLSGNISKIVTGKLFTFVAFMLLQIGIILWGIIFISNKVVFVEIILRIISIIVALYIINKPENPSYKLAWIIPLLLFPALGCLMYLCIGKRRFSRKQKIHNLKVMRETAPHLVQDEEIIDEIRKMSPRVSSQVHYLGTPQKGVGSDAGMPTPKFPIYKRTTTEFLSPGNRFFVGLVDALESARAFIFLEYFIIEEGEMWDTIHDILKRKVKEGVEVRVIYDDIGCIKRLPPHYDKKLTEEGIKCRVFNPFGINLTKIPYMNNRDHRKIAVIDGYVGFTGGVNLADEYINVTHPFGEWMDAALKLKGEAVWSLTIMFLQMWNQCGEYEHFVYRRYSPNILGASALFDDGYVMPYCDNPLDTEVQAEMVYLNMINKADNYIYISTPYLIIDNEMATALSLAAKNGVDVRIVLPHKYDKWYVHICSQANYQDLIRAGVKVYEFKPGFIHSKTFVCDDEVATVGTVNLDYRSLYLHYECGVFMYKSRAVIECKEDYLNLLKRCKLITERDCTNVNFFKRILRGCLKVFAPLM